MSSELDLEIQQHIRQYLSGSVQFENWFVPILWETDNEDEPTRALAGAVHLAISEFSAGDRTLERLREGLAHTIPTPVSEHKPALRS